MFIVKNNKISDLNQIIRLFDQNDLKNVDKFNVPYFCNGVKTDQRKSQIQNR